MLQNDEDMLSLMQSWAMLGPSLCYLGRTWGLRFWVKLGAIFGHVGAIVGLPWEDLGATWVHLGHYVQLWGNIGRTLNLLRSALIPL